MPKLRTIREMTPQLRAILLTIKADYAGKASAYAARPYLDALLSMPIGASRYMEEDVDYLCRYLRGNLKGWRGEIAAETKAAFDALLAGQS